MWGDGSRWGVIGGDFGDGGLRWRGTRGGRGPGPEESEGVGGSPLEHAIEQNIAPFRGRNGRPGEKNNHVGLVTISLENFLNYRPFIE